MTTFNISQNGWSTGRWPTKQIDHINGNKQDNRIANLREATNSENHRNKPIPKNNTSGFKGVTWNKRLGLWRAYISLHGRQIYLGHFASKQDAVRARQIADAKYHGEFAYQGAVNDRTQVSP